MPGRLPTVPPSGREGLTQPTQGTPRAYMAGGQRGTRCWDAEDISHQRPSLQGQEKQSPYKIHRNKNSKVGKMQQKRSMPTGWNKMKHQKNLAEISDLPHEEFRK